MKDVYCFVTHGLQRDTDTMYVKTAAAFASGNLVLAYLRKLSIIIIIFEVSYLYSWMTVQRVIIYALYVKTAVAFAPDNLVSAYLLPTKAVNYYRYFRYPILPLLMNDSSERCRILLGQSALGKLFLHAVYCTNNSIMIIFICNFGYFLFFDIIMYYCWLYGFWMSIICFITYIIKQFTQGNIEINATEIQAKSA